MRHDTNHLQHHVLTILRVICGEFEKIKGGSLFLTPLDLSMVLTMYSPHNYPMTAVGSGVKRKHPRARRQPFGETENECETISLHGFVYLLESESLFDRRF